MRLTPTGCGITASQGRPGGKEDFGSAPARCTCSRSTANSSIDFELRVWIDDPWKIPQVRSALYFSIWYKLKAANIAIPFPQRDLHVRDEEIKGTDELALCDLISQTIHQGGDRLQRPTPPQA